MARAPCEPDHLRLATPAVSSSLLIRPPIPKDFATPGLAIANDILALLNQTYGSSFPVVGLADLVAKDPAVRHSIEFANIAPPVQP